MEDNVIHGVLAVGACMLGACTMMFLMRKHDDSTRLERLLYSIVAALWVIAFLLACNPRL